MPVKTDDLGKMHQAAALVNQLPAVYPTGFSLPSFALVVKREDASVHGSWRGDFFLGCTFSVEVTEIASEATFLINASRLLDGCDQVIHHAVTGGVISPKKRSPAKLADEFALWGSTWKVHPLLKQLRGEMDPIQVAEVIRGVVKTIATAAQTATAHL